MGKATCRNCKIDVLEELETGFNSSCENGPPDEVYFYCKYCDTLLMFEVEVSYTMVNFRKVTLPVFLTSDFIDYNPDEDGYDYNIIMDFVGMFKHILPIGIENNNRLDKYLRDNNFYEKLNCNCDAEASCSYWLFTTEDDAKIFVTRLNKWLKKLSNN